MHKSKHNKRTNWLTYIIISSINNVIFAGNLRNTSKILMCDMRKIRKVREKFCFSGELGRGGTLLRKNDSNHADADGLELWNYEYTQDDYRKSRNKRFEKNENKTI